MLQKHISVSHLRIFHFSICIFGSTVNTPAVCRTLSLVGERRLPPKEQRPQRRPLRLPGDGGRADSKPGKGGVAFVQRWAGTQRGSLPFLPRVRRFGWSWARR